MARPSSSLAFRTLYWIFPFTLVAFSLFTIVVPAARAFYRLNINYNEGWNAYNAEAAAHHVLLYGTKYDWTTVNYPFGSFYLIGFLSRFGGDPVRIGRFISLGSLFVCCVLVGWIVRRLTGHWGSAVFAGAFCLALFGTIGSYYVGMNDPQMLAHPLFLAGLLLYLGGANSTAAIGGIVGLFVLGGNIKHILLPSPLAVFFDLCSVSKRKATQFLLFAATFLGASVAVNMRVGGPFFISKLMTPRTFSMAKVLHKAMSSGFSTLQIPLAIAILWSIWHLRNPRFRVISLYFLVSLVLGLAFTSGEGVSVNAYFDIFLAMSIVMGLCVDSARHGKTSLVSDTSPWRLAPPALICLGLLLTFAVAPIRIRTRLRQLPVEQQEFDAEVAFIASRPGPVLCESILACFYAGKPFVYDSFNAGCLMKFDKLDSRAVVEEIADRRFGAIQIDAPLADMYSDPEPGFSSDILDAINRYYVIGREAWSIIYVPRPDGALASGQ